MEKIKTKTLVLILVPLQILVWIGVHFISCNLVNDTKTYHGQEAVMLLKNQIINNPYDYAALGFADNTKTYILLIRIDQATRTKYEFTTKMIDPNTASPVVFVATSVMKVTTNIDFNREAANCARIKQEQQKSMSDDEIVLATTTIALLTGSM